MRETAVREVIGASADERTRVSGAYLALVLIWSTTPLSIVLSVREIAPIWALLIRFTLALLLVCGVLLWQRQRLPLSRAALRCYVAGSLSMFWSMLCSYLAAPYIPSGLISLIYGVSPLLAGLYGHLIARSHRLGAEQWLGMLIALIGLIVVVRRTDGHAHALLGVLYVLVGVLCYVASMFWLRYENERLGGVRLPPLIQTMGSLILSWAGLLVLMPWYWAARPLHMPDEISVAALVYGAVFASLVAMFCNFYLVMRVRPATLSLVTLMTPVLALFFGAWLNHEPLSWSMLVGAVIVIGGLGLYFFRDWRQMPDAA